MALVGELKKNLKKRFFFRKKSLFVLKRVYFRGRLALGAFNHRWLLYGQGHPRPLILLE